MRPVGMVVRLVQEISKLCSVTVVAFNLFELWFASGCLLVTVMSKRSWQGMVWQAWHLHVHGQDIVIKGGPCSAFTDHRKHLCKAELALRFCVAVADIGYASL